MLSFQILAFLDNFLYVICLLFLFSGHFIHSVYSALILVYYFAMRPMVLFVVFQDYFFLWLLFSPESLYVDLCIVGLGRSRISSLFIYLLGFFFLFLPRMFLSCIGSIVCSFSWVLRCMCSIGGGNFASGICICS